jgi:hypothetical protein
MSKLIPSSLYARSQYCYPTSNKYTSTIKMHIAITDAIASRRRICSTSTTVIGGSLFVTFAALTSLGALAGVELHRHANKAAAKKALDEAADSLSVSKKLENGADGDDGGGAIQRGGSLLLLPLPPTQSPTLQPSSHPSTSVPPSLMPSSKPSEAPSGEYVCTTSCSCFASCSD